MESMDPEDLKKIRKLRKILRQIENLQLLPRELNPEEILKISKRVVLRQQLNELNEKYAQLLLDNSNISLDTSDIQTESSFEEQIKVTNTCQNIDTITEKLGDLNISNQKAQNEISSIHELKPQEQKKNPVDKKIIEEVNKPVKKLFSSLIRFKTLEIENAHEDLITCLDICGENLLLATGSRDTTIKIWNIENGKLLHSFGGHTGAITCLRFWSLKCYKKSLENIINTMSQDEPKHDEAKQFLEDLDELEDLTNDEQLILSSSLDCSFRLWRVKDGNCIRQFYLYNSINNFDLLESSIVFALDAGKIEYWNDLIQKCVLKAFDDTESVREIQFKDNLICALTSSGNLKIFMITDNTDSMLNLLKQNNFLNLPNDTKKMYKNFILLNDHQVLLNNAQSYLISQNLISKSYDLIPNNTNDYSMSTCIYKFNNFIYACAYDIDRGVSTINVFSINDEIIKYEYTFEDQSNKNNFCISTINFKNFKSKNYDSICVTASSKSFKIWNISHNEKNNQDQRVKYVKLVQKSDKNYYCDNERENLSENEYEDEETKKGSNDNDNCIPVEEKKTKCNVQ